MVSSTARGIPAIPAWRAFSPSCTTPFRALAKSFVQHQRHTKLLCTLHCRKGSFYPRQQASVIRKATAPALRSPAKSVSARPHPTRNRRRPAVRPYILRLLCFFNDISDRLLAIRYRLRVRHTAHGGITAAAAARRTGRNVFLVYKPRIAQMTMQFENPGKAYKPVLSITRSASRTSPVPISAIAPFNDDIHLRLFACRLHSRHDILISKVIILLYDCPRAGNPAQVHNLDILRKYHVEYNARKALRKIFESVNDSENGCRRKGQDQ